MFSSRAHTSGHQTSVDCFGTIVLLSIPTLLAVIAYIPQRLHPSPVANLPTFHKGSDLDDHTVVVSTYFGKSLPMFQGPKRYQSIIGLKEVLIKFECSENGMHKTRKDNREWTYPAPSWPAHFTLNADIGGVFQSLTIRCTSDMHKPVTLSFSRTS